ncbi:NACHT domain-containing protein [Modestobacter sp. VKM Ac-2985]|uniref:NACHT domain-containing protein n=1 Tax=Modestobacter sp. VKM Ac-2985 TaxID=3004139 RepID=UPI0022ABA8B1|nr:NACHT domain-containing protein [Modestobacter sp. VKM Ac-2985]MCZ2837087.1 NACHT domain-containing protein [Modestobacter sp. VKM Ac-2985]
MLPGIEAAALRIGMTVARVSGTRWLKNRVDTQRRDLSLAELAVASGADLMQGRKVGRQFDQLADDVAQRVLALLEHEFKGVPENERLAAVDLAGVVLQGAGLADRDILAADLSIPGLTSNILKSNSAKILSAGLSQEAHQLFVHLLRESIAYVVDAVGALPEFQQRGTAELLRRDTLIISKLTEALDRGPQRDIGQIQRQDAAEEFTFNYRREIARRQARIELFGLPSSLSHESHSVASSYVSLAVTQGSRERQRMSDDVEALGLPVEQVLAQNPRLLLLGPAGSGKTTILQWLALQSAQRAFESQHIRLNSTVPILLMLRQLDQVPQIALPRPEGLVDQQSWTISADKPHDWTQRLLESGKALILIDGVDELRESDRGRLRKWVEEMTDAYPLNRWVITSRPEAVPPDWLQKGNYTAAQILPMSPSRIRSFVSNWHDAASEYASDEEKTALRTYEPRLIAALDTTPTLRSLANNPLLCAMMCVLHKDRKGRLPHNRMQLYRIAMDMMLAERDEQRQVAAAREASLSPEQQLTVVQKVAYWYVINGHVEADYGAVLEKIREALPSLGREVSEAESVLKHLLIRSGLLRRVGLKNIDFLHKTFQEYLAAKEAVESDCIGQVLQNLLNDSWREVVILAVGHARPGERNLIVSSVLELAEDQTRRAGRRVNAASRETKRKLQQLALDCLETAQSGLSEDLRQRVLSHVQTIFPPRSLHEVVTLASYGAQVMGVLESYTGRLSSAQLARCISLAGSIGTERGFEQLTRYAAEVKTAEGWNSLVSAWSYFPPDEYAVRVLNQAPYTTRRLILRDSKLGVAANAVGGVDSVTWDLGQDVGQLEFLADGPPVAHFTLTNNRRVRRLAPLTHQDSLRVLRLRACSNLADDFDGSWPSLAKLELRHVDTPVLVRLLEQSVDRLKVLSIAVGTWTDAAELWATLPWQFLQQTDLEYLELEGVRGLRTLAELGSIPSLKRLRIASCPDLSSLDHLSGLPNLEILELDDCGSLSLNDWYGNTSLRGLSLVDCPTVLDASTLAGFANLKELVVSGSAFSNGMALSSLPISRLHIEYTHMAYSDQEVLQKLCESKGVAYEFTNPTRERRISHTLRVGGTSWWR